MKKISIMILFLVAALASCKKTPEVNLKYVDVERDLITVGATTATVQCDYKYIATLKKAFLYYGEGVDEADMNTAEMRVVQNTLYVDLAGLRANTSYNYYYEFHNGFNSMRTVVKTFKTESSPTTVTSPTVVTASVTDITTNSAKSGGEVTNDGSAEVTERGICWSTNVDPTLNDNHVAAGTGTGAFTAMMESLEANTIYHVRAYATNEAGTAYGLDREFTTLSLGGNVPEGAVNGLFTINDVGDKVFFSQGNLQYQASTNTWRFAENQWNYVGTQTPNLIEPTSIGGNVSGSDNYYVSPTYSGWIDLFGWGTSGWNNGNVYYHPYDYMTEFDVTQHICDYGPTDGTNYEYDLTGFYANADWGVYNPIANGGNLPNQWRTLTNSEWIYVFDCRTTITGIRFAKSVVNGVNGVVLLPDDWDVSIYSLNYTNNSEAPYSTNEIGMVDWGTMEANGVVFLPAGGYRNNQWGSLIEYAGSAGAYWSASYDRSFSMFARYVDFGDYYIFTDTGCGKPGGQSVRLVRDANK